MRRLAIVAVVRDQGHRLVEWLAFHRAIGVRDFVIYDDGSRDDTAAILTAHAPLGVVTVPWPEARGSADRLTPQNHFLASRARLFTFAAFLGVDEFLVPPPGRDIEEWVARIPPYAGSVLLPQFSLGLTAAPETRDLVLRRLTRLMDEPNAVEGSPRALFRQGAVAAMPEKGLPDLVQGERLTSDFRPYAPGRPVPDAEDGKPIRLVRAIPGPARVRPSPFDASVAAWIGPTLGEMGHALAHIADLSPSDAARFRASYADVTELGARPGGHALWRLRHLHRRRIEAAGRGLRRLVLPRGPRPW